MKIIVPEFNEYLQSDKQQGRALSNWYGKIAEKNGFFAGRPGNYNGCQPFCLDMLAEGRTRPRLSDLGFVDETAVFANVRYLKNGRRPIAIGIHPETACDDLPLPDGLTLHKAPSTVANGRYAYLITRTDVAVEFEKTSIMTEQ